jgi:hypothetical protein
MKHLLTGTAFLVLAASHPAAKADPIVFDFPYTGSLVTFTVPTTDTYQILAFGAQGGPGISLLPARGGRGAEIGGDFGLTAGESLQIAVGGVGGDGTTAHDAPLGPRSLGGGGGGGSFVVGPGNTPLVIAGGGGGSFDAGDNQILMADFQTGYGEVIITELAAEVPEPASIALLGVGVVSFLGLVRLPRYRR